MSLSKGLSEASGRFESVSGDARIGPLLKVRVVRVTNTTAHENPIFHSHFRLIKLQHIASSHVISYRIMLYQNMNKQYVGKDFSKNQSTDKLTPDKVSTCSTPFFYLVHHYKTCQVIFFSCSFSHSLSTSV